MATCPSCPSLEAIHPYRTTSSKARTIALQIRGVALYTLQTRPMCLVALHRALFAVLSQVGTWEACLVQPFLALTPRACTLGGASAGAVQAGVAAAAGASGGRRRGRPARRLLAQPQALQRGHHPRQGPPRGRWSPCRAHGGATRSMTGPACHAQHCMQQISTTPTGKNVLNS